jgi:hypothetical protein
MKLDKKTIMAIVLIVAALGVVLYQMRGVFMPSRPATTTVAAKSNPATTPAAGSASRPAAAGSGIESVQSLMENNYGIYIAELEETDINFAGRRFKNPMTPIAKEGEDTQPQVWVPVSNDKPKGLPGIEELSTDDTLEGIVWNIKDPLALLNDQVVGVGEELDDGAVVTAITQDTVKFSRNGNRYYLVLREE